MKNPNDKQLTIIPTPIGNMDDITIRALQMLKQVDVIACEDKRHTGKLLKHLGIEKRLIAYHEHNEKSSAAGIVDLLEQGLHVGVVSDAGMPGISDPGRVVIEEAAKKGYEAEVLPGANAALTALVKTGFDNSPFQFVGFLERGQKILDDLETIRAYQGVSILYEAPHRLLKTLDAIHQIMPERRIALVRELTKIYEEIQVGTASELMNAYEDRSVKGEFVVVIERPEPFVEEVNIEEELKMRLGEGMSKSRAVKEVATTFNLSKNEVYEISLNLSSDS